MKSFLERKFGNKIVETLYDTDQTTIDKSMLHLTKEESQEIVFGFNDDQEIIQESIIKEHEWAFDFPGYTGSFSTRKYMVIGLEPHINQHNFQKTYDIDIMKSSYDADGKKNTATMEYPLPGNSKKLWRRLIDLAGKQPVNSKEEWLQFVSQFYITDLCHFAPKGQANLISGIKTWSEIRAKIARKFLPEEIALVKPDVIITHGGVAAVTVGQILGTFDSAGKLPQSCRSQDGSVRHISVGHLASGASNGWWKEHEEKVKEEFRQLTNPA